MKYLWANGPPKNIIGQMNQYIKNLKTPIAIVGMGRSGESARKLLQICGVSKANLITFDSKTSGADFKDPEELLLNAKPKSLVISPGVPLKSEWIQKFQSQGVHITSEISIASSFLTSEKVIGVTGSLGKSTTVSVLGVGARSFSPSAFVGGNLGTPFCEYVIELLQGQRSRAEWVILELSSYQLENASGVSLDFSAITYLSPNHLERYLDLTDYYETKWSIKKMTKGTCFLNEAGGDLVTSARSKKNLDQIKIVSPEDPDLQRFHLENSSLLGRHNLENISLAASISLGAGWPDSAIFAMKEFSGLEHRLENLGIVHGIRFINDSKATALDSVLIATQAAHSNTSGKLFLLLGGRDKNLPWQDLKQLENLVRMEFLFFGECREVAKVKSGLSGPSFLNLGEALASTLLQVKPNDTVLLSPGGTSLDEFKSFEERGLFFKKIVQKFSQEKSI